MSIIPRHAEQRTKWVWFSICSELCF